MPSDFFTMFINIIAAYINSLNAVWGVGGGRGSCFQKMQWRLVSFTITVNYMYKIWEKMSFWTCTQVQKRCSEKPLNKQVSREIKRLEKNEPIYPASHTYTSPAVRQWVHLVKQ